MSGNPWEGRPDRSRHDVLMGKVDELKVSSPSESKERSP